MNQFEQVARAQQAAVKESEIRKREQSLRLESEHQQTAKQVLDSLRLRDLNAARRETTSGSRPGDIWGEEVQQICDDFLEFAGSVTLKGVTFPYSKLIRPPIKQISYEAGTKGILRKKAVIKTKVIESDWSINGYGVAFTEDYVSDKIGFTADSSRLSYVLPYTTPSGPVRVFTNVPDYNVHLCTDGLIRVNAHPVDLASLDGELTVPRIGEFVVTKHTLTYNRADIGARESYGNTYTVQEVNTSSKFDGIETVKGIRTILGGYAANMLID